MSPEETGPEETGPEETEYRLRTASSSPGDGPVSGSLPMGFGLGEEDALCPLLC